MLLLDRLIAAPVDGAGPVNVIVSVGDEPLVAEAGLMVKELNVGGAAPHVGNLNEPIRVCQLPLLPFAVLL